MHTRCDARRAPEQRPQGSAHLRHTFEQLRAQRVRVCDVDASAHKQNATGPRLWLLESLHQPGGAKHLGRLVSAARGGNDGAPRAHQLPYASGGREQGAVQRCRGRWLQRRMRP